MANLRDTIKNKLNEATYNFNPNEIDIDKVTDKLEPEDTVNLTDIDTSQRKQMEEADDKANPWAICTASVGREDKDKYESCIRKVKSQYGIKEDLTENEFNAMGDDNEQQSREVEYGVNPYSGEEMSWDDLMAAADSGELPITKDDLITKESVNPKMTKEALIEFVSTSKPTILKTIKRNEIK